MAPLCPHPSAVSTVLCLVVACAGELSLSFLLCQTCRDRQRTWPSRSPSSARGRRAGAVLCSAPALGTVLTLHSAASATLDSYFQGWVLLQLTGAQAGKTTNLGVNMYNTVNKMFFEIQDGTCVFLETFACEMPGAWGGGIAVSQPGSVLLIGWASVSHRGVTF